MSSERLVSVILPVFNGMPYLKDSVQSILDQSYIHWELVIVNDGSSDESAEYIVTKLASAEDRIRYVEHSTNKGIAAAYNTGIKNARGRFIAFQEQDDVSLPTRLEIQVEILGAYKVPFVTSRVGWMDEKGRVYHYWPDDIHQDVEILNPGYDLYCKLLIHQTCMANATTMIDRRLVGENDLVFDERFKGSGQDWDLHLRIVQKYSTIRLRQPLVLMRRHKEHDSSTSAKLRVFQESRLLLKKHWYLNWQRSERTDVATFLKAWSNELLIEARYFRGRLGLLYGILSFLLWPRNPKVWSSFWNVMRRLYDL